MTTTKTKKIVTLLSFVILISSFIAYKSGAFDKEEQTENLSLNSGLEINEKLMPVDTPGVDSIKVSPNMISSSKSMMMIDRKVIIPKDTSKRKRKRK
jgi:hypothetical protein